MKKNFLTVIALMVTAFFAATEIAQAADVTFSGQLRTRYEVNEQSDFRDATEPTDNVGARVRFNANVNINDNTSAFIQMQSARTWGESLATGGAGSGNASFTASDGDASVGLHQAYVTLKNFAGQAVDLKLGRQQIVLDGHRLFGHTGWTTGAQTHDALRLTHAHDNMAITYAWIIASESGGAGTNNLDDVEVQLVHFNRKGILGGKFSAIYAYVQDGCGARTTTFSQGAPGVGAAGSADATTVACTNLSNDSHTIGFRQAGQLYGIDYRGEYYRQWGDARADAVGGPASVDVDRGAYMFGVRLGKSFKKVSMKPSLTFWYDYLSGTSDEDARNNDYKTFDTLFDTGHKFYGLMDLFTAATGGGTKGLGLQDLAIKAKMSPMPGWTLKADYHWFWTAEGATANPDVAGTSNGDTDLGTELDVTLINKYNANTNISFGWSNYNASSTFQSLGIKGTGGATTRNANWGYIQVDVKF